MLATAVLIACGPSSPETDVYPRNCGEEGPVDLAELSGPYVEAEPAGDYVSIYEFLDIDSVRVLAVDRCGDSIVELVPPTSELPVVDAVGSFLLRCEPDTEMLSLLDPEGLEPPRELLAAAGCRAVPVGGGFAVHERDTSTVWFFSDPADPEAVPVRVTDDALPPGENDGCLSDIACDALLDGNQMRAAGDDLLVVLEDGRLFAFSTASQTTRTLYDQPLRSFQVLQDDRHVAVDPREVGAGDRVIDLSTGEGFGFCCTGGLSTMSIEADWLEYGQHGAPLAPAPEEWTNLRLRHLPTGTTTEFVGNDWSWSVRAAPSRDALLVSIQPHDPEAEASMHLLWPETKQTRPIELSAEHVWTAAGRTGAYAGSLGGLALSTPDDEVGPHPLWFVGPDFEPRVVLDDAMVVMVTASGRIVFHRTKEDDAAAPLRVMLPDERVFDLDENMVRVVEPDPETIRRPVDRDEVLYIAEVDGRFFLRRTVLP